MTVDHADFCSMAPRSVGFTLVELTLAMALATLLVLGLVQIVSAASAAGGLQRNQALIQDHARFAIATLSRAVRQAGYRPEPWNEVYDGTAFTTETLDGITASSDRLSIRSWSDLNCFDSRNPDLDSEGHPRFYLRESVFDLTGGLALARLCRYGPNATELTTQVRRQGFVAGVESFQVLFGEDGDADGSIESWLRAGQWSDPQRIMGVRIGLLLSSEDAVVESLPQRHQVLDWAAMAAADGRLRRVYEFTVAIRGRTP